jgi:hypothetical protein
MGLEVIIFLVIISVIRKDRGACGCLKVNKGILGVFFAKGRVFILVLGDVLDSHNINKWDTCHARYTGQKVLHLVEDLCGGGSVEGQGGIFRLLVLGILNILVALLHSQKADLLECGSHKWFQGHTNLS